MEPPVTLKSRFVLLNCGAEGAFANLDVRDVAHAVISHDVNPWHVWTKNVALVPFACELADHFQIAVCNLAQATQNRALGEADVFTTLMPALDETVIAEIETLCPDYPKPQPGEGIILNMEKAPFIRGGECKVVSYELIPSFG